MVLSVLLASMAVPMARAQAPLDLYGGRTDIHCTAARWFTTAKVGNRWWFCDPLGHGFTAMSITMAPERNPTNNCSNANTFPIFAAKYAAAGDPTGTTYNWAWQNLKRATSWGFNAIGELSSGSVLPNATCPTTATRACTWPLVGNTRPQPLPRPYLAEPRYAEYAAANTHGYLAEPIKDLIVGTNQNWHSYRGASTYDVFDPKLYQYVAAQIASPNGAALRNNDPWILGIVFDDSDWFAGSGAGPDFITVGGKNGANLGFLTLLTSPVQTYNSQAAGTGASYIYLQQLIYSKANALSPTTTCSLNHVAGVSQPCSLRDYLWQKYTNNGTLSNAAGILALDAAWHSNYDSFDSDGVQITNETIGTGDGTTTVFNFTLTHRAVDPYSVLISVGGKAHIGDCPWFHRGPGSLKCEPSAVTNTAALQSPLSGTQEGLSSIACVSGVCTITWKTPSSLFHAGTVIKLSRTGTPACNEAVTLVGSPGALSSTYNSSSCTGAPGGPNANGLASASILTAGSNTLDYSTGVGTISFVTPPALGMTITANYIYGGWMGGGRGLMDESGGSGDMSNCPSATDSVCWVGTNSVCLEGVNAAYPTYFACIGAGGLAVPNACGKPMTAPFTEPCQVGLDLDNWIAQFAAEFFSGTKNAIRNGGSKLNLGGLDVMGGYGASPIKQFLQGAAPYLDFAFTGSLHYWVAPSPAYIKSNYQYFTQYFGDKPIYDYAGLWAQADSSANCITKLDPAAPNFPTQAARGQAYYDEVNFLLTTPSYNGDIQFVGHQWWSWQDFPAAYADGTLSSASYNQGVVSYNDNAYDGKEAVSASVRCDSTYTVVSGAMCGSENSNYGDALTTITAANALWNPRTPPPSLPPAQGKGPP